MPKLIFNADLMFRIYLETEELEHLPLIKETIRNHLLEVIPTRYNFCTPEISERPLELVDYGRRDHTEMIEIIRQKLIKTTQDLKEFREKNFNSKDFFL